MNKKAILGIFMVLMLVSVVVGMASASDVSTDRLNFDTQEQHTVTITNTLGETANSSSEMPTGFSFVSSVDGCTNPSGQTVTCDNIADGNSASFIMSSTTSGVEYELYTLTTTLNGNTLNDVDFLNIADDEIIHTLVEYGRGRGNYFYDSMGTSTSAGTGTGYNYVPNATDFELNYLHKIFNIKQYFGLAGSQATDVQLVCEYPYHTVVREHMATDISEDGSFWTVTYEIPRIDGSWERMSYLGMDIDAGEYNVGDNFTISCTGLTYALDDAYGSVVVDEDSFSMEVRDPNPLDITALSGTTEIGNGTSEVAITYTITNNEVYPIDSVIIEIDSPENAQFIGVRGELWGTAKDKYTYELTEMQPGQSEIITLVGRFDTTTGSDTELLLSEGVKAKFVPTWELNAYNPMTYIQNIDVAETQTVNYAVSSQITSIQSQLDQIESNTVTINNTLNGFSILLDEINATTHTTGSDLLSINSSLSTQINDMFVNLSSEMDATQLQISSLSTQVSDFENTVQQLVNCTANPTADLCVKVDNVATAVANIQSDLTNINSSLSTQIDGVSTQITNLNSTVMSELSTQFTNVANNFSYTNSLILDINSSLEGLNINFTGDINELTSLTSTINTSVTNMYSDLLSINTTINGQLSAFNNRFDEIMSELSYMQGFNEELVFLVTDSVGLAQESQTAYNNGDTAEATAKLEEATALLVEAQDYIESEKARTENEYNQATNKGFKKIVYWVEGLFL